MDQTAGAVLPHLKHKIVLFDAPMGVGKTTFIKSLAKAMKVVDTVNSPTFALVNEYRTEDDDIVYHFDCYRLKNEEEALNIGIEDYFDSGSFCLIEWPEKIAGLIPDDVTTIKISVNEDGTRVLDIIV
ncbi:MAG: tRNA (adenosine(37)-N6)-threonylcarbamoyltransferase complex ATPase subunit type 1 TsaE [Flavobacteriia bacterium]|nr:MAG: tRNA (adenosine(37)-N6)-threonylcarbamoyltransferase complex ATPase subunit type 1 TsaE [Flavobacteriia bacterium]